MLPRLCLQATEADLRQAFAPAGFVWELTLPRSAGGRGRGFAFVGFTCRTHAEQGIKLVNSQTVAGRPVAVDWAVAKAQYGGQAAAEAAAEAVAAAAAAAEQEQRQNELMGGLESDSDEEGGGGAKLVSAWLGMWAASLLIGTACLPCASAHLQPCGSFLSCLHLARVLTACLPKPVRLPARLCAPLSGPRGG